MVEENTNQINTAFFLSFSPFFSSCFARYAGVTTMLNFFTTSNGFRSTLPVVSNLTAMNVWDGVCMCFIYASLLEFVCVNYVGRKRPLHNVVYRPGENPVTQVKPLMHLVVLLLLFFSLFLYPSLFFDFDVKHFVYTYFSSYATYAVKSSFCPVNVTRFQVSDKWIMWNEKKKNVKKKKKIERLEESKGARYTWPLWKHVDGKFCIWFLLTLYQNEWIFPMLHLNPFFSFSFFTKWTYLDGAFCFFITWKCVCVDLIWFWFWNDLSTFALISLRLYDMLLQQPQVKINTTLSLVRTHLWVV